MEPPIGYVPLRAAIHIVGDKMCQPGWSAADWRPTGDLFNPEIERVITKIAGWCEAGEVAAVYRSIAGVDDLDRSLWRRPHWRHYFVNGTIDLDLPLVDENLRPNPNGYTARCTREIYLRRNDLDRCVAIESPLTERAREMIARYSQTLQPGENPSKEGAAQFARDNGMTGGREELRAAYDLEFGPRRRGRPYKSAKN